MKRIAAILMALTMMITASCASAQQATGIANGFGGKVSVTLTEESGILTAVEITGSSETAGVGSIAIDKMADFMLESNSVQVDIVSGATLTSNAILEAANAALTELGIELTSIEKTVDNSILEPVYTDVLVVGGGGAGLAAAVAAAESGADVVLVEKLAFTGGSTAMSGGIMCRAAIEGDPEGTMTADDLFDYFMQVSENKADPAVVRAYVDNSAADCAWAMAMGNGITEFTRYHVVPENIFCVDPEGAGAGLIAIMEQEAHELGADIRLETKAISLIYEDNRVKGAVVESADGVYEIYAEGGVVLAAGGFALNSELLQEYGAPNAETVHVLVTAGATGEALVMARDIGAKMQFGNDWDTNGYHTVAAGYGNYLSMIGVNNHGVRIGREDDQLPMTYTKMVRQIGEGIEKFYYITDLTLEPDTAILEAKKAVKFDTIEEMAAHIGCETAILQNTINEYNANTGKEDPITGKAAEYMKGIQAPYYCIETSPVRTTTIGGLVIDEKSQVINNNDQPISGLYAAGEIANSTFFYNIYATCGSAVQHAITFGRIAGMNAAGNTK